MKIKNLHIKNFKSIVDLEIVEPNPFTVFVGPNGSGKSNIFEALEFRLFSYQFGDLYRELENLFPNTYSYNAILDDESVYGIPVIEIYFNTFSILDIGLMTGRNGKRESENDFYTFHHDTNYQQFVDNHSEIFISNTKREKIAIRSENKLSTSCSNLEKVLKRILQDEKKREEIKEWLELFIPGFQDIQIVSSELSSTDTLIVYEKGVEKPFTKDLLSDGTYNILSLLSAVYQSDEPQFLCIEEPENGLHPEAIKELVGFFRTQCEEKGHYIWLNTHSQSLVSALQPHEVILVNKREGQTQIKQLKGKDLHGLAMDEAWLSNALGGGLTW